MSTKYCVCEGTGRSTEYCVRGVGDRKVHKILCL